MPFFGRTKELNDLKELMNKTSSSLVVIRGRQRVGKTRLVEEFSHSFQHKYFFSGLAPRNSEEIKEKDDPEIAQRQRESFADRMYTLGIPCSRRDEWRSLFSDVAKHCRKGRTLVFLMKSPGWGWEIPPFLVNLRQHGT